MILRAFHAAVSPVSIPAGGGQGRLRRALSGVVLLLALLMLPGATQAAGIILTFQATVASRTGSVSYYDIGQSVTITITTSENLGIANYENGATAKTWLSTYSPERLWANVTLTGATGAYEMPTDSDDASSVRVRQQAGADPLNINVQRNSGNPLGTLAVGGLEVAEIFFNGALAKGFLPAGDWDWTTPLNAVFPAQGTTTALSATDFFIATYSGYYNLTPTSLTITATPEPSRALLLVGGGLSVLLVRRRRRV